MGRTLKNVPLDFAWRLNKVWEGYINPYQGDKCKSCECTGYAPDAKIFHDQWYGYASFDPIVYGAKPIPADHQAIITLAKRNCSSTEGLQEEVFRLHKHFNERWMYNLTVADVDALIAADRLWDFTHVPITPEQYAIAREHGNYWLPESNGYIPTPEEVNEWAMWHRGGHDAINRSVCVKARCKREGVAHTCPVCNGEGAIWQEDIKRLYEAWIPYEPPSGPGFQLWETTSEGSPVSPVFESLDKLCVWCEKNATTFASYKTTADKWKEMLQKNHVYHKDGNNVFI